ncbi:MAG: enoyl-CoA hydratase [Oceanospirillaceae bacterium]|jgi:enoyl-CoA hydratase/carnithine racemase|uniref:enoyl-CoA hydratase-related protein n=1 Tax=Marinobacterium litorale TaxID=404770 RepID=UPI000418C0D3|nr:enoyl-CoA hydratase-related protein [Marinobacterium litorale]MBT00731.1 enoyl-CoA hydratase [Oceanospirillaceae bacterium]
MCVERIEHRRGVVELRLSRPDKKNALTQRMYHTLVEQLELARSEPDVRVVLLTGSGEAFCSGNDIADFLNGAQDPSQMGIIVRFLHTLVDFPKPLLAAVHGDAVGIGTTMLLHCDRVIAADNLKCQMPFVRLGLVPEGGSSLLLPQALGQRQAFELLIEGKPFDAEQAKNCGLVNQIVSRSELEATALESAWGIAALPEEAVQLGKELLKAGQREQLHTVIDREARLFASRLSSREAQQAFTSFLQAG